ncbi:MAG: hypothetical protein FJ137_12920 [Deltaproteobacteria bacterium]|nr:hypothetical protein [Deltaproteobacteria bacterium]
MTDRRRAPRPRPDAIIDAFAAGLVHQDAGSPAPPPRGDDGAPPLSEDIVVAGAVIEARSLVAAQAPPLWGSAAFFRRAAEELVTSTRTGRELAGACYLRERRGRVTLVGLKRELAGQPGRVGVDPSWGSVLWHTHPGLKGSLAAFSLEDLDVAKQAGKPLLVVGFVGISLDVLSTLALPFGWRSALAAAGIKGLLSLEKSGRLPTRLLELGVGARVCWPSGLIRPVLRRGASPLQKAVDEMGFVVDRGVGAVERTGQRALRAVLSLFVDPPTK